MADISNLTYDMAAHLLLRAGFGHDGKLTPDRTQSTQVKTLLDKASRAGTPQAAIDSLLSFRPLKLAGPGTLQRYYDFATLESWWINRMMTTATPVREKMTLFLHTHFATASSKVFNTKYMADQNKLLRYYALGDFRDLVKQITIDPAMLWWLDNQFNVKDKPNENYARELQELFTLGVYDFNGNRNYSQQDVVTAARILTGWLINQTRTKASSVYYDFYHDSGPKTMYTPVAHETDSQDGQNMFNLPTPTYLGATEYTGLVDGIFNHLDTEGRPTAARYIARKMWKFFAYDPDVDKTVNGQPGARADLALIDTLADEFKSPSDPSLPSYSLKALLRKMFMQPEFYADSTRTVKGPVEYVVGSLRMLHSKLVSYAKSSIGINTTSDMGQEVFNPPNVFSWKGNLFWITTETLLSRYSFAAAVAHGDKKDHFAYPGFGITFDDYFGKAPRPTMSAQQLIDFFVKQLSIDPATMDPATNTQLLNWLNTSPQPINLDDDNNPYVRGLIHLILTLPQYNTH